jgi:hypothetical protein
MDCSRSFLNSIISVWGFTITHLACLSWVGHAESTNVAHYEFDVVIMGEKRNGDLRTVNVRASGVMEVKKEEEYRIRVSSSRYEKDGRLMRTGTIDWVSIVISNQEPRQTVTVQSSNPVTEENVALEFSNMLLFLHRERLGSTDSMTRIVESEGAPKYNLKTPELVDTDGMRSARLGYKSWTWLRQRDPSRLVYGIIHPKDIPGFRPEIDPKILSGLLNGSVRVEHAVTNVAPQSSNVCLGILEIRPLK